jgi:hypothetical protein
MRTGLMNMETLLAFVGTTVAARPADSRTEVSMMATVADQRQWRRSATTFASGVLLGVLIIETRPSLPDLVSHHAKVNSHQPPRVVEMCFAGRPNESIEMSKTYCATNPSLLPSGRE